MPEGQNHNKNIRDIFDLRKDADILKFKGYEDRKERINSENKRITGQILALYGVVVIVNLIAQKLRFKSILQDMGLMSDIFYMLFANLFFFFYLRKKDINFTRAIYLFDLPIFIISILQGTIWDPFNLTYTFFFYLLTLPLLILDKPWRIFTMVSSLTVFYVILDLNFKALALRGDDMRHLVNAFLISTAAMLYTLMVRIQNLEYAGFYENKADRDPLTGLYNRYGAYRHFGHNRPGLMVYLDLDHFKEINDTYGHERGNQVLQETANALRSCFRKDDILVRMGGDEFVVFAPGIWTEDIIERKMKDVLDAIDSIGPSVGDAETKMSGSIGCAYTTKAISNPDELLRIADHEMYIVKRGGKNGYRIKLITE